MEIQGKSLLGFRDGITAGTAFRAFDPATGEAIDPPFCSADTDAVCFAAQLAADAFRIYGNLDGTARASFLKTIANKMETIADSLVERAGRETALPAVRLQGEIGRTCGQLRLFANMVEEGSWAMARIDRADPNRKPAPRPDIRSVLRPIGPVAVFGASNFPLAFSVAGGDTASALAAGNPVVVKAHPAHPGTPEVVARAIRSAVAATNMPAGVFSMVHGRSHDTGLRLVRHPATKAVGFTGSLAGGQALMDVAAARPDPIPVFSEMSSTNP